MAKAAARDEKFEQFASSPAFENAVRAVFREEMERINKGNSAIRAAMKQKIAMTLSDIPHVKSASYAEDGGGWVLSVRSQSPDGAGDLAEKIAAVEGMFGFRLKLRMLGASEACGGTPVFARPEK